MQLESALEEKRTRRAVGRPLGRAFAWSVAMTRG